MPIENRRFASSVTRKCVRFMKRLVASLWRSRTSSNSSSSEVKEIICFKFLIVFWALITRQNQILCYHRFNFNDLFHDMTAFSPPAESWIIHYPKKESQAKKAETKKPVVPAAQQLENPCRLYIDGSEIPVKSNKSLGTDDHFKSAVCSKNLLKVCEKLMGNKKDTFMSAVDDSVDDDFGELSLMNEKSRMEYYRQRHGNRRSSQSLPASPKMDRKALPEVVTHNPYFTVTKPEPKKESISFLTNLFGITAVKPAEAKANLSHKYEVESKAEKFANPSEPGESTTTTQRSRKLTPNPNEYREMNIFSPTSM